MPSVSLIVEHLDSLLDPAAYDDYGPNGLQVPGRETVQTVVTAVSANVATFTRAREEGADLNGLWTIAIGPLPFLKPQAPGPGA